VSRVLLDLHAPAATEALLPAPQFTIEKTLIHCQPGRHTGEKSYQGLSVRLSGCEVTKHKLDKILIVAEAWRVRD
jgi:hypothetical protein